MASSSPNITLNHMRRASLTRGIRHRRAIRPCDPCRVRKSRCVIPPGSQFCMNCQSRRTACTFDQKPPPRPHRSQLTKNHDTQPQIQESGSHSKQTYRCLAPHSGITQGTFIPPTFSEDSTAVNQTICPSSSAIGPGSLGTGDSSVNPEAQMHNGQSSLYAGSFQQNSQDHDIPLGLSKSRFAELYGLGSDMEPILMRHRPYDSETHEFRLETHSIRRVSRHDMGMQYPVTFHIVNDEKAIGYCGHDEHDDIERCIAPYGPSLMNLYWRIVHPCYPILDKRRFMERYSTSYREIEASVLGAVYLFALNWWAYDRELSNKPEPNATLLREKVIKAIQNSYHRPKLSSIEATLLLLQCKPEDSLNPDHTWSWGYTGQALSIGEALGLHLDASSWHIPTWERELRKRLSWALYMQDKWTALMHGRPSHVHDDNWGVSDIEERDFSDIDIDVDPGHVEAPMHDAHTGRRVFMEMVTLSKILSDILAEFYSLRASKIQDPVELFNRALPVLEKLHLWHENVPSVLSMDRQAPRQLCANGLLHLSYHSLILTLLRRVIRSPALVPVCPDAVILNTTRKLANDSAEAAITFVRSLRPDHLEAFWFFCKP
ncbi:fungal-specific transcription factor domain-containing protein [Aspergillus avenaceus]|uniref:Fungal-specific transcription factor domain-containing protein n=1 Tax=Aspergillus avenaceus TaxID=36643 RepID=A0A5N6TXG4_ASPAV|nr:fungal-specific transcription factor domain-containing protein [Aspergillus avenaceus]